MFEEKLLEPHFTSVLAPYMLDVVEQKRALGNKYNAGVEALSAFDDFCNEQQLRIPAISKELLQKWEKKRPHENETTQCFRISYVRILCKYLHSNGYDAPCAFHPAPHVNKCFVPYIFTKDEIERLFSAVDCTKESSESPLRHLVMPVLFRLLYTCGLRVSEALHLKVADVDLDAGVLAIYGAKGDKERLVGISDSMLTYMKSYRSNPLVANAKSIYFFPAPDGGFYDTSTIYDIFRKCLFDAGIPHRGRGKGPRLHDLRHSFGLRHLQEQKYKKRLALGEDIQHLAKQKHNLTRIHTLGYIEEPQFIERSAAIEQQIRERKQQLSRNDMSNTSEKILQKTRLIQKKLSSTPPLELFDESVFKELVKKVLISNTAIQFELINGMKLSESRAAT